MEAATSSSPSAELGIESASELWGEIEALEGVETVTLRAYRVSWSAARENEDLEEGQRRYEILIGTEVDAATLRAIQAAASSFGREVSFVSSCLTIR